MRRRCMDLDTHRFDRSSNRKQGLKTQRFGSARDEASGYRAIEPNFSQNTG